MKTLRYNTTDQTYTSHEGQYLTADNKAGRIDPPYVQLEVVETTKPEPTATEKLLPVSYDIEINEGEHDLTGINGTATEVWAVVDKSAYEIAMEGWHHPDWCKRIIAPATLVMDDVGVKMLGWWQIMGFPIEREGDFVYLYCNQILPQHQTVVDQLQGVITIEDRPEHIE
jgi:hypothetical protein